MLESKLEVKHDPLFKQIVDALVEYCNRFTDGDIEQLDNWEEQALSCPSPDLTLLLDRIPEDGADVWYELIDDEIKRIVAEIKRIIDEVKLIVAIITEDASDEK